VDALQLMSQWSSYMDNGGVLSPTSLSRKVRATRLGSVSWGQPGASAAPSPHAASGLTSRSRKKSYANPHIFGPPTAAPQYQQQGQGQGGVSIAAAIAQAVAAAGGEPGRSFSAGDISGSVKNRAPFSSKVRSVAWQENPHEDDGDDAYGFEDHGRNVGVPARRSSQSGLARDTSLKMLNKAKLSYREVMEG
jgi:hypothetical protein